MTTRLYLPQYIGGIYPDPKGRFVSQRGLFFGMLVDLSSFFFWKIAVVGHWRLVVFLNDVGF